MQEHGLDPLASAKGMRDLILENRDATETNRQIAGPVIEALTASRLGQMSLPAEYAGLELPPPETLPVLEALAEAEASVAWIVWNSSLPCWLSRFLEPAVRAEIFTDPAALFASSTRPSGRATRSGDAYLVNGRWSLVSGCTHAAWIPVMCLVEENGKVEMLAPDVPHMRMFFVPQDAHEILDTWHVGGLRGTGSHDTVLSGVTVPASHSFTPADPVLLDSPMGHMPILPTMAAGCASICLGVATTSLNALVDMAAGKMPVDGGPGLRERAPVQSLVARAQTTLNALRTWLHTTCEIAWQRARTIGDRSNSETAALLSASITTALQCRAIVSEVYAAAGASALYTSSPLERAHRDIDAVTQHIVVQPFWLEQAGRVRLGLEPTHPLFNL